MACGCALFSVGRPRVAARVTDADRSAEQLARELYFQIFALAFRTPSRDGSLLKRGDAGRIVAAVFEALERIDELPRDRLTADDPDYPHIRLYGLPNPCRSGAVKILTVKA